MEKKEESIKKTTPTTPPPQCVPEPPSSSLPKSKQTTNQRKPKVLYVGDSVGHTANLRLVEKSSKCIISSARAYSSTNENTARWPEKNFQNVVNNKLRNPGRQQYDILVMSAPTVDITNLDTSRLGPNGLLDLLEQKVVSSCQNMFNIAQHALTQNANLKKVIIMEHSPRFDDNIKSKLAVLANSTMRQLWVISPQKENIYIGLHSLECYGGGSTHLGRYQDHRTGKYDAVHFYGQTGVKDYTDSVKTIFLMTLPEQQSSMAEDGAQWQQAGRQNHRQAHNTVQSRYNQHTTRGAQHNSPVPTQNRFNLFNQGN